MTSDEQEILNEELKLALRKYKSKQGTYMGGYWKEKLENKVKNSIDAITSLLKDYANNKEFTEAQIPMVKKMIRNSALISYREEKG